MNVAEMKFFLNKQVLRIVGINILSIVFCCSLIYGQDNVRKSDTIIINGQQEGRIFQGIGGVSAGASTRLLYDYPEPERSQILDYLFKPNYGASIQILKVEIGGDMNSTDGAEASHMRRPNEINCGRGYEWWLMREAKKRNPDIKLAGLAWGTPGWVGDDFWSEDNIDYHLAWLDCAKENGFKIDYMGGWNERGYDVDWYIAWDKALEEHYPDIEIIGADECCREDLWRVVDDMYKNKGFMDAIDNISVHFACGHRSDHKECYSPDSAKELDKPLWMSENSAQNHDVGAMPIARALNRMYIDARITGYMAWSPVSAWYANMPIADTGLLLAEWPWSGYYQVGKSIWVYAHTAQFTKPGWHYIDNASGYLASGASYVTMKSPDGGDYSTIIEALDAKVEQTATFSVSGGLPVDSVNVWETNLRSNNPNDYFVNKGSIKIEKGKFQIIIKPGYLYTLSTTTGQRKGTDRPKAGMAEVMKLPYQEDFEGYEEGKLARYYSDVNGAFETAPCGGGRSGTCYRQVLTQEPINWWKGVIQPATIMGDPRWWGDYTASVDVLLEQQGYIELVGRISAQQRSTRIAGYHLQVNSSGKWELYRQDLKGQKENEKQVIAEGKTSFEVGKWHQVALKMKGQKIDIIIDNKQVKSVQDSYYTTGQIGLMVSPWVNAQFDNVKMAHTGAWPSFVPVNNMSIVATSDHPENHKGYDYEAVNAIDGRPETVWHSDWEPKVPLPQSIILNLGAIYKVKGLTYQPRLDDDTSGMITKYNIYSSSDGVNFNKVTSGSWPMGTSTKIAKWPNSQEARYVKLEAIEGGENSASVGEIRIIIADE